MKKILSFIAQSILRRPELCLHKFAATTGAPQLLGGGGFVDDSVGTKRRCGGNPFFNRYLEKNPS